MEELKQMRFNIEKASELLNKNEKLTNKEQAYDDDQFTNRTLRMNRLKEMYGQVKKEIDKIIN